MVRPYRDEVMVINKLVLALLLALSVVVVGCGKKDSDATTGGTLASTPIVPAGPELTLDQYNQKLEDLVTKEAALTKDEQDSVAKAKATGSKEAGLPIIKEAMAKFVEGSKAAVDDLAKVNPPADLKKFHTDAVTWNRKMLDATAPMSEAMATGDTAKLDSLTKDIQAQMAKMLDDYKADLTTAGYDFDEFSKTGKLKKK